MHGTGARRPILLLAHLDVVEAKRADWDSDPFKLVEVDGTFRARGAIDDKAMAAAFVANLIEYVKEGLRPDRDIILALTADEELSDSPHDGARWLLENHRALIDAELAINEGGGGALRDGHPARLFVQLAEKVYQSYRLEVTDPGGHSAAPRRDNPIYRLAHGLARLGQFDFPISLNDVTRAYFERVRSTESPEVAAAIAALLAGRTDEAALAPLTQNATYNAQLRTTCVATLLDAGHAENALPQTARATVNCRLMPGQPVNEVEATLRRVVADPEDRRHADRPRRGEPAVTDQRRGDGGGDPGDRDDVAGRAGDPGHVRRLHRQPLAAQRRHRGLRGLGPVRRSGQERRARPQ